MAVEAKAEEEAREARAEKEAKGEQGDTDQMHRRLALAGRTTLVGERIAGSHISGPHRNPVGTSNVPGLAPGAIPVGSHTRSPV